MPEISRFLGIVIGMFYREHGPAHLHAVYGEHEATIDIETGALRGHLPPRALALVREWAQLHREDLLQNWQRARRSSRWSASRRWSSGTCTTT